MTAVSALTFAEARQDGTLWAVSSTRPWGAHLVNAELDVSWWREGNDEVDYVVQRGGKVTAIEVKSGSRTRSLSGLSAFSARHGVDCRLVVGSDWIALADFLESPADRYLA